MKKGLLIFMSLIMSVSFLSACKNERKPSTNNSKSSINSIVNSSNSISDLETTQIPLN